MKSATNPCGLCSRYPCTQEFIYVVWDPHLQASKVGKSRRPVRRYAQHRKKVGKHVELKAYFPTGCEIQTLNRECAALAVMEQRYPRVLGDWYAGPWQDAVAIIEAAAAS